jgi:hypothetical protein
MALLTLISLIPAAMAAFAQGLIDFALVIANGGAEFTAAMSTLLQSLITAININGPLIIQTLFNLIRSLVNELTKAVPEFANKAADMLIALLDGIAKKVPAVARKGTDLAIALINALAKEVPRLADEGAKAIIKFVNGLSTAIDNNAAAMGRAGGRLATSIIRGMVNGIGAGIGEIVGAAQRMAERALNAAKDFLGIHSPSREFHKIGGFMSEGAALGITDSSKLVARAGESLGDTAINATRKALADMKNAVAIDPNMSPTIRPVLDLSAIKKDAGQMRGILTPPALKLDKSVAYASQAQMAGYQAQESANQVDLERWEASRGGDVNFYQTNNSPKALTNAEIYRKTNNQLSVAKKELTTTDA